MTPGTSVSGRYTMLLLDRSCVIVGIFLKYYVPQQRHHVMIGIMSVTPRDRCARCLPVICCCCLVIACVSCMSYHVIMCISFAYMFASCIRAFSLLFVLQSGAPMSSGVPFYLFSCAGVECSRIRLRLVMRPWFTTGRPPVKFHTSWTSFDTPTVN